MLGFLSSLLLFVVCYYIRRANSRRVPLPHFFFLPWRSYTHKRGSIIERERERESEVRYRVIATAQIENEKPRKVAVRAHTHSVNRNVAGAKKRKQPLEIAFSQRERPTRNYSQTYIF